MLTTNHIIQILNESALKLKMDFDPTALRFVESNQRNYEVGAVAEFKRDLEEAGRLINLWIIEQPVSNQQLYSFLKESTEPVILFQNENNTLTPELFYTIKREPKSLISANENVSIENTPWLTNNEGLVITLVVFALKGIVSEYSSDSKSGEKISPVKRLWRLLATETREIGYIMIYALIIGLLSLVLPLGLQTTVELISGGVFFSSVYILIALVIIGVFITGVLQIVQISLVEHLQRRIFTKAAFEFAFRIPRIRLEALTKSYAPELVNRFFDVITIQKGLPKILLDLSSSVIQIFFGLVLLSLYHPFFVFFSVFLVTVLCVIFYLTGPRGLQSSIDESKYKYKVVQWLEELARAIKSFKLTGTTDLPFRRTDYAAANYLKHRKAHFTILVTQFSFFVFFKVAVTGGLLIMGTILVVDRQINLGQFVASEVIIILVLNAVEKIILYIDVVYDMLTAVDKVAHVTDLPLEKSGGFDFPKKYRIRGYDITLDNLSYQFKDSTSPVLKNINLKIAASERICIAGSGASGKSTLTNIIAGLFTDYSGGVSVNSFSLRDLDLTHLRDTVAKNISPEDIFDGTIYENITLGKPTTHIEDVLSALERVGLNSYVNALPAGLNTALVSGGKGLPHSILQKLILARCLAKRPNLIILNDFFFGLGKADKLDMIRCVINPENEWTLVTVSNDPLVMASCDRVVVLDKGAIVADAAYQSLIKDGVIAKYFE